MVQGVDVFVLLVVVVVDGGKGVYSASIVTVTTPSCWLVGVEQVSWVSLMMVADTEMGVGTVEKTQNKATEVEVVLVVVAWKKRHRTSMCSREEEEKEQKVRGESSSKNLIIMDGKNYKE